MMTRFVDEKLNPFNTVDDIKHFSNAKELYKFAKENGIKDRQRFYYTVGKEDIVFVSLFEYSYEG